MKVYLFTDGGATNIHKRFFGASAYIILHGDITFEYSEEATFGTNNYFELRAIEKGIQKVIQMYPSNLNDIELCVVSDSQYSISSVTVWFNGWLNINGKYYTKSTRTPVMNIDQILSIRSLVPKFKSVKFIKIRAHTDRLKSTMFELYSEFNSVNTLALSMKEFLNFIHLNERCDSSIAKAIANIKHMRK